MPERATTIHPASQTSWCHQRPQRSQHAKAREVSDQRGALLRSQLMFLEQFVEGHGSEPDTESDVIVVHCTVPVLQECVDSNVVGNILWKKAPGQHVAGEHTGEVAMDTVI